MPKRVRRNFLKKELYILSYESEFDCKSIYTHTILPSKRIEEKKTNIKIQIFIAMDELYKI